jgi:PQQ-like domain
MGTRLSSFLFILMLVLALFPASATVYINGRTVTTSAFRVVWGPGTDVEAITELYWMGGRNLTASFAVGSCNNGDVEYFGNAWAPPDPAAGGAVLVGGGSKRGVWLWSHGIEGKSGTVLMQSTSKGCAPSSAGVVVTTTYSFDDTSASKDQFVVQRQFNFGQNPFDHDFRPYMPRFSLALGFTHVMYPAIGGELASMDARNCPYGCTGPFPAQGAAPLDAQWDSSQQWYAIHNPATGQGVVIMRKRALGAGGALIPSQLWIDWDGGSNTNSSSFLLMKPTGGFSGNTIENETFCFYDQNSWTPSMTPPPGCQPQDKSDWPQWGHDAGHTGYNSGERVLSPSNVGALAFKWALFNNSPDYSHGLPFAIANGMLYAWGDFGLGQGLYAFNAVTGDPQPIWLVTPDQLEFTNGSCTDPGTRLAVDKGVVYLACPYIHFYGWIFAINAANGAIMNQFQGDLVFTIYNDGLYLSGWQYVAARGPHIDWIFEDWELGFNYDTNHFGFGSPVSHASVDDGVALWNYQGFPDWQGYQHPGGVLAMNAEDGSVLWYGNPGGDSEPVATDGVAYLVLDGNLVAFNEKDGTQLRSLSGLGAPVIGGGMGYASCGGDLCAFNARNGKAVWRAPAGGSPVALANGVVYANGAFDAKTGRKLGGVGGIVANGMVYGSDGVSVILAFGLPK